MKRKPSRSVRHALRSALHSYQSAPSCGYVESEVELPGRVIVGPDMIKRLLEIEQRLTLLEGKVV